MNNFKSIVWGLMLVIFGILLGLRSFDILKFDIFFDGWWTLFIIIPCFVNLFDDDDRYGNLIGLCVGIVLLLAANDILSFELVWKLLFPVVIILIGLSCIFKNLIMNKIKEKTGNISKENEYYATFSGQKIDFSNDEFKGCDISVVFGGCDIDLTNAILKEDVSINISSIFGGVDIKVPNNCKIKVTSNSIFGGVDNKAKNLNINDDSKTIYINASCIFGGVEVK